MSPTIESADSTLSAIPEPSPEPAPAIPLSSPRPKKRKIGSKACDGCKIRKVRCSGTPPCERCTRGGIACTFHKTQATRGPRNMRPKTLRQIQSLQTQIHTQPGDDSGESSFSAGRCAGRCAGSCRLYCAPREPEGHQRTSTHMPALQTPSPPESASSPAPTVSHQPSPLVSSPQRTPVETLVLRLCIYRLRLFPVWPIVAVEEIIASLQVDTGNLSTCALANAIGAATMAQLKLGRSRSPEITDSVTAAEMAGECRWARTQIEMQELEEDEKATPGAQAEAAAGRRTSLNALRTSFFLHIYHENLQPGGKSSLLFLREAITLAQLMGLDRASSYADLPKSEQRMRRRIIWLLFVTERGVALLHKLPVVLTAPKCFPPLDLADGDSSQTSCGESGPVGLAISTDSTGAASEEPDSVHVLPAFRKLVNLFWIFDQSGALETLQNTDFGQTIESASPEVLSTCQTDAANAITNVGADTNTATFRALQQHLRDVPLDTGASGNDIQRADLLVTRQWMQILLWRALITHRQLRSSDANSLLQSCTSQLQEPAPGYASSLSPLQIASEFLRLVASVPRAALDAHGPSLEYKVYEISRAVADALSARPVHGNAVTLARSLRSWASDQSPVQVLRDLQHILASCRGGNPNLVQRLRQKIAQIQSGPTALAGDLFSQSLNHYRPSPTASPPLYSAGQALAASTWPESSAGVVLENMNLDPLLSMGIEMGVGVGTRLGVGVGIGGGGLGMSQWYYQALEGEFGQHQ
ncbi:hypothetical protein Cpir12675_004719 [Ceratocystis pirilliformis]|uniref:Zn(2)-C6 fungal-type domain-containing protein n=1 Tax=Ceratocystis pirilliformis TaxID=259994 RepID=A0ABR3YUG2_9PEZI